MENLTKRQQQVLDFVAAAKKRGARSPSLREIGAHFGFKSPRAAADHLTALKRKGYVDWTPNLAGSLRLVTPMDHLRQRIVDIPLYGSIPAGRADHREQAADGCISVDIETVGIKPTTRTFALQVRGDSMIGKHILEGDLVIVEHGQTPRNGDVVAALIDGDSTLKTYVANSGKPYLKAENPRYPKMLPAAELVIQGVMVALIRKRK
jgi:repressor LexA